MRRPVWYPLDGQRPRSLKALGCDGAIGTITVDLAGGTATGGDGQKILSCQNGSVDIESTRYPFCLTGSFDKPDPATTAGPQLAPLPPARHIRRGPIDSSIANT